MSSLSSLLVNTQLKNKLVFDSKNTQLKYKLVFEWMNEFALKAMDCFDSQKWSPIKNLEWKFFSSQKSSQCNFVPNSFSNHQLKFGRCGININMETNSIHILASWTSWTCEFNFVLKFRLIQIIIWTDHAWWGQHRCDSGLCGSCSCLKLGQAGETGQRVLSSAEAQQGESYCNTAMHNTIHALCPVLFNFFVPFSQEEKEKEREQKEKAWETSGLPSTPGGGIGATAQQDHGGARCYLLCFLSPEHWRQEG